MHKGKLIYINIFSFFFPVKSGKISGYFTIYSYTSDIDILNEYNNFTLWDFQEGLPDVLQSISPDCFPSLHSKYLL